MQENWISLSLIIFYNGLLVSQSNGLFKISRVCSSRNRPSPPSFYCLSLCFELKGSME